MTDLTPEQIKYRAEYWTLRHEHPGEVVEWSCDHPTLAFGWYDCEPMFDSECAYYSRLQPKPIGRYPQVDLPMPVREITVGDVFFCMNQSSPLGYVRDRWNGSDNQRVALNNGAIYLSESDIKEVVKHTRLVGGKR